MKKDNSQASEHPVDLLLPFLENELGPEERKAVEDHLRECASCSAELETYMKLTSAMKNGVSVFCPEPWEIFEFAVSGKDTDDRIARHLSECVLCRDELERHRAGPVRDGIPSKTWQNIENRLHGQGSRGVTTGLEGNRSAKVMDWFRGLMRFRLALAATATAILIIVFLYPSSQPGLNIALSSEEWASNAKPLNLMAIGSKKPKKDDSDTSIATPKAKAATVILFEDSAPRFNSQEVDELYSFMKPPTTVAETFDFITPKLIKESVESGLLKTGSLQQLVAGLRDELKASEVMIISIGREKGSFRITGRLISADTGRVSKELVETDVKQGELGLRLQRVPVLLQATQKAP